LLNSLFKHCSEKRVDPVGTVSPAILTARSHLKTSAASLL
jgi:hypothetical protein